jgi:hypothetical protein
MNDIEYLLSKYFGENNTFSEETSAHWRKYGEKQRIELVSASPAQQLRSARERESLTELQITGEGFGDFKKLNLINLMVCIPIFIYCAIWLWPKLKVNTFSKTLIYTLKSKQIFGYDVTRMASTIDFLQKNVSNLNSKRFCVIGDGYGRLGSILKSIYPNCSVIYINLGRTLLFDYYYTSKVFTKSNHQLIRTQGKFSDDFTYIEAERYREFKIEADVFVNIASMQEMNMKSIVDYFDLVKSQAPLTYFYCANRISKNLPDGSIINFNDYPWSGMKVLIDELCPWHQKFPTIKPPFIRRFDGPLQHRLVITQK